MHHNAIDYAVIGEAENILPDFLPALESGGSLFNVKGIGFRDDGRIIITSPAPITEDLDTIAFPARHLLKNNLYHNILSTTKNFTVMLSAKGCPYKCTFCDLNTKKFRMRSAANFVDEIELNYNDFRIKEFDIYDSSFTIDKQRVLNICDEILKKKLKVSWTARSRIDNVNKDLLQAMSKAGCNTLMYGIESADSDRLRQLNKYVDMERIKEVIRHSNDCGIKTLGFFMLGVPGETYESAKKTINFTRSLGLDYIQVTRLTPFPNTQIYSMLQEDGFGDYWREFTLDASKEIELPLVRTGLTSGEVMRLVRRAYLQFYLRPGYILRRLKKAKSILELKNSLLAAKGLIFDY